MKKSVLIFLLITSYTFSQSINDYQYVIVSIKFNFLKENDKYRLNTLTKLLLQKYNFKSYLSTEQLPAEIENQRCVILYASVSEDNNFFLTKVKVVLKDCKDQVVYETEFGTSREKEYAAAYNEALRAAFKSFDKLRYKYNGKNEGIISTIETETETTPILTLDNSETFYFAQPITNGFQIVNNEPKVIMQLLTTSQKNVFIALKGDTHGVVISRNGQWFFEYYENTKLVSELLQLKF